MTDDFDFDLPFRLAVTNSIEKQNLLKAARRARRTDIERPRPVLNILNEFVHEKIGKALYMEKDYTRAACGLSELRHVLRSLVSLGHTEFKERLKELEAAMARYVETGRLKLIEAYLDPATPRKEIPMIRDTLVECIEFGAWPNWENDIQQWGQLRDVG
jgi:hypothetical protein